MARRFLLLLSLILPCAGVPPPEGARETWYVVFDRGDLAAAVKALERTWSPEEVAARTMAQVYRIYAPWNIRFIPAWEVPSPLPEGANAIKVHDGVPVKGPPFPLPGLGLLGRAPHIDEWNRETELMTGPGFGVFVDNVAAVLIQDDYRDAFPLALASLIAHETGHCLGLYHLEATRDICMGAGLTREGVHSPRFAAEEITYLDRILGPRP